MKLHNKLYTYVYQGQDNNCNTYLMAKVLSQDRHVLIDPGHITTGLYREAALDKLVKSLAEDGIKPESIGLVILTHSHPDHCEAAMYFRDKGAKVALHEKEDDLYTRLGGKSDIYLEEGALVLGGDKQNEVHVIYVPGHSPGHIALYWVNEKALFVGDVVFYRSTGRVDLPGGSASEMKQSIERLSKLDVEYLLCGHPYGHPGVIVGKDAVIKNFEYIKHNFI